MKAVILAAGESSRFNIGKNVNKLTTPFSGVTLLEQVIHRSKKAGIKEFLVVTGYQEDTVRKLLGNGQKLRVRITYVHNIEWKKGNGTSLFAAQKSITEHFFLLMGDHLFDPEIVKKMKIKRLGKRDCMLAIDKDIEHIPDLNEATKVRVLRGNVVDIGKEITNYNAVDTGIFVCSPYIFSILSKTVNDGRFFLTDAMKRVSKRGLLKGFDIEKKKWIDIDRFEDFQLAQELLRAH